MIGRFRSSIISYIFSDAPKLLSENLYLELAQRKIEQLTVFTENHLNDEADCSATNTILRINYKDNSIVINTQTPNRQLWYSSPISGPQRFDYDKNEEIWINTSGKTIESVLKSDLDQIV